MDFLIIVGVALLAWLVIAPLFGVIAFAKLSGLQRENRALRDILAAGGAQDKPPSRQMSRAPAALPPRKPAQAEASPSDRPASAAPIPETATDAGPAPSRSLERLVAGNWMVWVGGLAMALGGVFLVRVAIDAGLFGPLARTLAGAVFGVGLVAAAFPVSRLDTVRSSTSSVKWLPHLIAGAGITSLYGASLAAGALYGFLPPLVALGLFAAVSLVGLSLSLRFGPVLAAISLAGAFLGPLFTGADGGSALFLLPYAASIVALGLALTRFKGWRFVSWVTLAGAAFWGLAGIGATTLATVWAVPVYALALSAMAAAFASDAARQPVLLPQRLGSLVWLLRQRGESLLVAHGFWLLSGALILISALDWPSLMTAASAVAAYGGLGLALAWRREGFGLFAPIAAGVACLGLALWPAETPGLTAAYVSVALGFGVLASLAQARVTVRSPLALAGAVTPVAVLAIAFARGGYEAGFGWGLGALLIALLAGLWLDRQARSDGGLDAHPGAAATYAIALALSACLAPFLVLNDFWFGPALAAVACVIAYVHRRFPLMAVRGAATLAAAGATILMLRPGLLASADIVGPALANTLSAAIAFSIAVLLAGAWALRDYRRQRGALHGAAILIGFGGLGLVIRHAAGAEHLFDGRIGLAEASGHAIAYLGSAVGLAWRGQGRGILWRIGEGGATLVGAGAVLAGLGALSYSAASGLPVFNLLLPAFAIPALFLAVQGEAHRRHGTQLVADGFSAAAIVVGGLWLLFETRRVFVGGVDVFTAPTVTDAEMWAYSLAGLAYAAGLLVWGVWRERPIARYASLVVLLGAVLKVFLLDLEALDGALRAFSFIGLGAVLIGAALFYQRFVFTTPSPRAQVAGIGES